MNTCEQAEKFRLLLLMGMVGVTDIVAWADGVILANDLSPGWLLDISLATSDNAEKMESKLRDLPCESNKTEAAYAAIEHLRANFESGKLSVLSIAQMLKSWAASARVSESLRMDAMTPVWIADEISYGNTSENEVIASVDRFMKRIAAAQGAG